MDKNSKYSGIHVFRNCYFNHAKGDLTREEWQRRFLRATQHLQYYRLAYKTSPNFSRARSAIGRFFMFSAAKARERAGTRLVSPAKKPHQVKSFWRELFASLSRVLSRWCVVASCQSMSKQTNNGKKFR